MFVVVLAYDLTIPSFIDSSQMLRSLLNQWEENETEKLIRDTGLDDILNADNKEDCEHCDDGER